MTARPIRAAFALALLAALAGCSTADRNGTFSGGYAGVDGGLSAPGR